MMTARIAVVDTTAFDAAQIHSANTTSSSDSGALMIASQVRCMCIRENAEYIASKLDVNIALWQTMPGADERDVFHAADLGNERADAVAQRDHVEQRIGDVAEDARDGELFPDQQVAPPHAGKAKRHFGKPDKRSGGHDRKRVYEQPPVYRTRGRAQ